MMDFRLPLLCTLCTCVWAQCGDDHIAPISPVDPPLLLRAARGEKVERTPVWMMRQAGRHMQVYRDLVKDYPTFRDRSETPEISFEISMQPYRAYKTDGVILFSDILTPLPATFFLPETDALPRLSGRWRALAAELSARCFAEKGMVPARKPHPVLLRLAGDGRRLPNLGEGRDSDLANPDARSL